MARDVRDLGDLARGIRQAYLAVNAAIPLPFAEAGVVAAEASPQEKHLMTLRETAFTEMTGVLVDTGFYADPADLAALARGELPAPGEG